MEKFPGIKTEINDIEIPVSKIEKEDGEKIWAIMNEYKEIRRIVAENSSKIRESFGTDASTPVIFENIGEYINLRNRQFKEANTTPVTSTAGSNTMEDGSGEYASWNMIAMPFDAGFNKLAESYYGVSGDESDNPPEGTVFLAETGYGLYEYCDETGKVTNSYHEIDPILVYKIKA